MNKALRLVWLSLLTLVCGVASAGTVVFDPATDVSDGQTITKDGISFSITSSDGRVFTTGEHDGKTCYEFTSGTYFQVSAQAPTGNITAVTFEYENPEGYIYDRNYYCSQTTLGNGTRFNDTRSGGADVLKFAVFSGSINLSKVTVEYIGDDPGTGGDTEYTIADLASGAADVASATIKFTDAQVVYASSGNYIVREGSQAIDLIGSSLPLELGATLNGKVTMSVAYNGGIMKATDIDGVTNSNELTVTGATYTMNPVTTTLSNLKNYKGDLVKLEQATLYHDTYNDFGLGSNAYFVRSGYSYAYLSNASDFSDKITDDNGKYDIVAWFNAPGQGMYSATLQIVQLTGEEPETLEAPVISGEQEFDESTTVTITAADGAYIYYTTDGSEPSDASANYSAPFTLTETATVKAIAWKGGMFSPVAEKTFTKAAEETFTIAQLAEGAQNKENVTVKFNNAKVVYGENKSFILREDGKALDVMNTSIAFPVNGTVSGTVKLNVTYTNGVLTTSDIEGVTSNSKLDIVYPETFEAQPLNIKLTEIRNYPGDLVRVENVNVWGDDSGTQIYTYDDPYTSVWVGNAADYNLSNSRYDVTMWYYEATSSNSPAGTVKVIEAERAISYLSAPNISGDEAFAESTTVTITSYDNVATIYYTTDGTTPTKESDVYTEPFVITENTTVKAIAAYKSVVSEVSTKEFKKGVTIAQLAEAAESKDNVTLILNNAKVVYGESNESGACSILREDGKAIDIMNSTLSFPVNGDVTGFVTLNVTYTNGVLTTSDIEGVTNSYNLNTNWPETYETSPVTVASLDEVKNYPGDLVRFENADVWTENGVTKIYAYDPYTEVLISNATDFNMGSGKYNVTGWFNDATATNYAATIKATEAERVINYLAAPSISGEDNFAESTTVTITADAAATIYYTTDGTTPTKESNVYTEPFVITETTTVMAFAAYKDVVSEVASQTFNKGEEIQYNDQTIAELNVRTDREDNIRLNVENAKVVYVRENPYVEGYDIALRQDGKAVMLVASTLNLPLNSTVTGSVKLNFYGMAGIPQLREIDGATTMDDLQVTESAETALDPTDATFNDVDEHKADLVIFRTVKVVNTENGYAIEKDGQQIAFVSNDESFDVSTLIKDDTTYDVTLWYNEYRNDAPYMEFVSADNETNGIYGIDANYGEDGNTYNLQGMKVNKNYRGVVIRDGKKFVQK